MIEGQLCVDPHASAYSIDCRDDQRIERGAKVEVYLGGQWIAGRIHRRGDSFSPLPVSVDEQSRIMEPGRYILCAEKKKDIVTEASEESFPASDPPAWTMSHDTPEQEQPVRIAMGAYFVADTDRSICGLCTGMRVRLKP